MKIASKLFIEEKNEALLEHCQRELSRRFQQSNIDSLEIARLYQYIDKVHYKNADYLECIKYTELAISFCNDSEEGRLLKGKLYSDKASAENYTGKDRRVFNSTLNAIELLNSVKEPDFDYLITSYRFLSEQCAYHGYTEDAKRYLRQAENLYKNNKKVVDSLTTDENGYAFRYDITLLYSKIYQLYKHGRSTTDSLELMSSLNQFEKYHNASDFNIEKEGLYYVTALNHIGDWYASRNPENLTTTEDLIKAQYYINRSIELVESNGYSGNLMTFKYNKVKALALNNELDKANDLMSKLYASLSDFDYRSPFFMAQKALIKTKQKQKDSAMLFFYESLNKVHNDSTILSKDLSNFKPSTVFGHTKLLLRIAEELYRYFPEDTSVNAMVAKLYPLAFLQFEHSYDKRKFNKTQRTFLKQIIHGLIRTKKLGYNDNISPINIINRYENIQNLLTWQKFNQNRQINNFPELDSLQFRNYGLRSQIAEAKSSLNTTAVDSLNILISQTEKFTKETFPNLSLFNSSTFKIENLMAQLKPNQLVVEYVLYDDQIVIFSISQDAVKSELRPWTKRNHSAVDEFLDGLKKQDYNEVLATEVANAILPEISPDIEQLILNPDSVLSKFPFEVLSCKNKLLIEKYQISYSSNLAFIFPDVVQANYSNDLAVYAPEYPPVEVELAVRSKAAFLEGAQKESELISQLFPSNLYNGKQLSKQDFIETASQYKLLHLAMHAMVDETQFGISRLLFSDADSKSDDLFLEELYGLNLSAQLAVLSACNTGVDYNNSGTDIESFQRAFTFAGVPATVASLWEVPDMATKEVMVNFYENLKNGQTKSLALKNAKMSYKKAHANTKLEQPYYWAGFVLYGEDSSVVERSSSSIWILMLMSLALIATIFILKRRT